MVETESLRPAGAPASCGLPFFLTGYRLFVRHRTPGGKNLRGLQILRSDANRRSMVALGNLLSHYRYRLIDVDARRDGDDYRVQVTESGRPGLHVVARLNDHRLPSGSIFSTEAEARRFAGPMPFTFDYERATHSMIRVEGVRGPWNPRPVAVDVVAPPHFEEFGIDPGQPRLANAFLIEDLPYLWKRGVVERLSA